jgi:hypothetical protein
MMSFIVGLLEWDIKWQWSKHENSRLKYGEKMDIGLVGTISKFRC